MSKTRIFALINLLAGLGVIIATIVITTVVAINNPDQGSPEDIFQLQLTKHEKEMELSSLHTQLKTTEINIIDNIDKVKRFIDIYGQNIEMRKSRKNKRGIQYLLSGNNLDVLLLLHKLIEKKFEIDITRLGFKGNLIAEINIVGAEK